MDEESNSKFENSTSSTTITPFSINDILKNKEVKPFKNNEIVEQQDQALDMTKSNKFFQGSYIGTRYFFKQFL